MDQVRKILLVVLLLVLAGLLVGCGQSVVRLGWVETSSPGHFEASYTKFTGTEKRTVLGEAGKTLFVEYDAEVHTGDLRMEVEDPFGKTIWCACLCEDCGEIKAFSVDKSGCYTISISGEDTEGSFDLAWEQE